MVFFLEKENYFVKERWNLRLWPINPWIDAFLSANHGFYATNPGSQGPKGTDIGP